MADTAGQSAADSEAADRREAHLKAAADSLAAQRARDDEEIAQQRLAEDEALGDARTEKDRGMASSPGSARVGASAVQSATTAVWGDADPGDPHTADLRTAVAELQAALADHLDLVPDQATEGTVAP